jgi:hypothetical protein
MRIPLEFSLGERRPWGSAVIYYGMTVHGLEHTPINVTFLHHAAGLWAYEIAASDWVFACVCAQGFKTIIRRSNPVIRLETSGTERGKDSKVYSSVKIRWTLKVPYKGKREFVLGVYPSLARINRLVIRKKAIIWWKMLIPLEQTIFPWGRTLHQKRLVIHLDNCSVRACRASTDWLEEHGMTCMLHSLYSYDLSSSDFYLFSIMKEQLERIHVADRD